MTPGELERYLHDHIPLSRAMQASVISVSADEVVLQAPLAPNINHRETVFGGSASALCILAAWSLVHVRLDAAGLPSRLVIQRNLMDYLRPVQGEFQARARLPDGESWRSFLKVLGRRRKARIGIGAVLESAGEIAGRLAADFVALRPAATSATVPR